MRRSRHWQKRKEPIGYATAKGALAGIMAIGLVGVVALVATASSPVTRLGTEYSGIAPTTCSIEPDHGTDLSVKCTPKVGATTNARIRYRMLADVGGIRDGATVSADITTWVGEPCTVSWRVPTTKSPARTVRVVVPLGSYCDIASITWSQP